MLIHVNAAEHRAVFRDIKPIFKGIQDAPLLGFTVEGHVLYITCQCGVVYEQQMASEESGPYSLTVLYQDLSELLPGHGTASLELTPLFVGVRTENMSATLQQANGMISRYKPRCKSYQKIPCDEVKRWARLFSETAPVAKSLQREASIIFKPPHAIMKYSTFWLQVDNTLLDTCMDLRELKAVADFGPTEFGTTEDAIEFRRGAAIMALARTTAGSCKFVEDMLGDHEKPVTMAGGAYLPKVQQFLRSVGPGPCSCYFYSSGMDLAVNRPKAQSSLKIGRCDNLITSLPTFLEYTQMVFKIFGDAPIDISKGRSSICLCSQNVRMLLATV